MTATPDFGRDQRSADRGETPLQRSDRNFSELLQELRVAQTGVQILFAFLLTMPFQARFTTLDTFQLVTYVLTLLLCAAATALLIAPVAYHRATFAQGRKPQLVRSTNRLARAGLGTLSLAISAAVLLVLDVVLGRPIAVVIALATAGFFGVFWYALPVRLFSRLSENRQP